MEILLVLRAMRRRRWMLGGGVVFAVVVFVALGGTSPASTSSAVAWTQVAVDTPRSQLIEVAPSGAETLSWRASLVAPLMATDASTGAIAHRLGVDRRQVLVVDPDLSVPLVTTSEAQAAAKAASEAVAPYVLTVFLHNTSLPVISLEAAAPDRASAQSLANAAVAVLQSQQSRRGRYSSLIRTNANQLTRQALVLRQVAPVRVKLFVSTALPRKAFAASVCVLLMWCVCGSLVARRVRWHPRGKVRTA